MLNVVLRDVKHSDAQWIFDACQDGEIQRWTKVPRPYLMLHAEGFCRGEGVEERYRWAIWENDVTDVGLGLISVHKIENHVAELGYWIAPWARRLGVCTRAVDEVISWLTDLNDVVAATARIAETNSASQRVVTKAGFSVVGPTVDLLPDGDLRVPGLIFRREL